MIKIKRLAVAIARLHNFCMIHEQLAMLSSNRDRVVFTPRNATLTAHEDMLQATAAEFEWEEMEDAFEQIPWSMKRDQMAKNIEYLQLTCPGLV
jgi:hypothetical protein